MCSAKFADSWQHGGGAIWQTPTYDPELGLIYFGVGNPGDDLDDSMRPGDNLYNNSIVAVDIKTGKRRWHYQMVPHDMWDYDAASPTMLIDVMVGGRRVPAVAHAGKTGWVYVLDRRTGERIVRSEPFVPHFNTFARPTAEGVRAWPSQDGGSNWPPMAYSPRTGWLYVLGQHLPTVFSTRQEEWVKGRFWFGGRTTGIPGAPRWGTLTAIDPASGKIAWQDSTERPLRLGGALATAGDLVFYGDLNGFFNAVDARTGERLWRFQTGATVAAAPMSYMLDGRQYIAVASLGALFVFALR